MRDDWKEYLLKNHIINGDFEIVSHNKLKFALIKFYDQFSQEIIFDKMGLDK